MSAFFVALRESVNDPEEMRLYAEKAGLSAEGTPVPTGNLDPWRIVGSAIALRLSFFPNADRHFSALDLPVLDLPHPRGAPVGDPGAPSPG